MEASGCVLRALPTDWKRIQRSPETIQQFSESAIHLLPAAMAGAMFLYCNLAGEETTPISIEDLEGIEKLKPVISHWGWSTRNL